ncbi:MAG: response regulator, partial [Lachnospiraceae bacterium]|nr:response regulator [Lachnospiraceae bacterium]
YVKENIKIPVIFLTAKDEETDVVKGLDMGADDYIIKPFRNRELISRINNVLRRNGRRRISFKLYKNRYSFWESLCKQYRDCAYKTRI